MSATVNIGTLEGLLRWKADDAELNRSLTEVAKKADVSKTQLSRYNKEIDSITAGYKRVAAALDPTIARTQRYEKQIDTLTRALKAGIISQEQFNRDLSLAKQRHQEAGDAAQKHTSVLGGLTGSVLRLGAAYISFQAILSTVKRIFTLAIDEALEASETQALLASTIRSTGGAAGMTIESLDALADAESRKLGIDNDVIAAGEKIILGYTRIGREVFPEVTRVALDMASHEGKLIRTQEDLAGSFQKVGKLVSDPIRAIALFKREGKALEEQQIRNIQQFIKQGDLVSAQGIVLDELRRRYGGAAQAMRDTMGGAFLATETAWKNLLEEFGKAIILDSSGVNNLAETLQDPSLIQAVKDIGEGIGGIASALASVLKYLGPVVAFLIRLESAANPLLNLGRLLRGPQGSSSAGGFTPTSTFYGPGSAYVPPVPAPDTAAMARAASEAERIAKAYREAREHVNKTIDDLIRQAEKSAEIAKAAIDGPMAVKAITLEQKIIDKQLSEEKRLQEKTGNSLVKLYDWQLTQIRQALTLEAAFTDQAKINLELFNQQRKTRDDIGQAEAEIADLINQSTVATRAYAKEKETLAVAESLLLDLADPRLDAIRREIDYRHEQLAQLKLIAAEEQRAINFDQELARSQAELQDAIAGTTLATEELIIQDRISQAVSQAGVDIISAEAFAIADSVRADYDKIRSIEARTTAQLRHNEALQAISHIVDEFSDFTAVINSTKRFGSELTSILQQHGLLSDAVRERFIQEESLARFREERSKRTLESIQAEVRAEQDAIQAIETAWAEAEIDEWVKRPFTEAWDSIESGFLDTLNDMILEGEADWEGFWKSFLRMAVEAIEEWLRRWIVAHRVAQAVSLQTTAISAGGYAGGGGGLFGLMAMGAGGGAATGATGASGAAVAGGLFAGGAGGYGSVGAIAASFGWILPVAAGLYVIYKGFIEKSTRWAEVNLQTGASRGNASGAIRSVTGRVEQIIKDITDIATSLDLEIKRIGDVTLGKYGDIYYVKDIVFNLVGVAFQSAEEAMEYARVRAIQLADLGDSVTEFVRAALSASTARTVDALQRDLEIARRLEGYTKPADLPDMREIWERYLEDVRWVTTTFRNDLTRLGEGLRFAGVGLVQGFTSLYNQLAGIKEDPRAVAERTAKLFNAQVDLARAEIRVRIAQIESSYAYVNAITGHAGAIVRDTDVIISATKTILGGASALGQALAIEREALLQILADLESIPRLDADQILRGTRRGGTRGASQAGQSLDTLIRDTQWQLSLARMGEFQRALAEINRKWDEATKGGRDYDASLSRARKARDEAIKAANGDKDKIDKANDAYRRQVERINESRDAIDRANQARRDEIRLLEDQRKKTVVADFQDFLGLVTPFDEIRNTAKGLIDEIEDSPFGSARKAAMIGRVMADVDRQIEKLSRETAMGLFGEMLTDLEKFGASEAIISEARKQMAIIEHTLKLEHYRTEIAILEAEGKISKDVLAALKKGLDFLDTIDPTRFINLTTPISGPNYDDGTWIWTGAGWVRAPANDNNSTTSSDARSLFDRYREQLENPWLRAVNQLNEDFTTIRQAMGDTAEVTQLYADSLERLQDQFLGGIRDFYTELSTGAISGATIDRQAQAAEIEYNRLLALVQGGDLSQADALLSVVQQWADLQRQLLDPTLGGFEQWRQGVLAQLRPILGITVGSGTGNSSAFANLGTTLQARIIGGPDRFTSPESGPAYLSTATDRTVSATNNVASVIDFRGRAQERLLDRILNRVETLISRVERVEEALGGSRDGIIIGDDRPRLPGRR